MDPQTKRRSLRNITYGVYVLTVRSGDNCAGVQSDEPPLSLRSTGWSYGG